MRKIVCSVALLLALTLFSAGLFSISAGAADSEFLLEETFEAAFKGYSGEWAGGGPSPIKMQLQGDTLTFDYSPVFYFDEGYALTDGEKARIVDQCTVGFQRWAGTYPLYGREITVEVNVNAETTDRRAGSSVRVQPTSIFPGAAGVVPGSLLWRPDSPLLAMYLVVSSPKYRDFEGLAMHEFGHVLGLFDAYGYSLPGRSFLGGVMSALVGRLLPEAPLDRAPWHSIMRGSGGQVTSTEIAMLLYAWKNNRLQLYTESALTWLGAEVSPVFSQ